MSPHFRTLTVLSLCLCQAACATLQRHRKEDPRKQEPSASAAEAAKTTPAAAPRVIGVISLVNAEDGFVLIDSREMPAPGSPLKSISGTGNETAVLKTGAEQRRPFVIADILKGEPHSGEQVVSGP